MKRIYILVTLILVISLGVFLYLKLTKLKIIKSEAISTEMPANLDVSDDKSIDSENYPESVINNGFKEISLVSADPGAELVEMFGLENASIVLSINRTDDMNLTQDMKLVVPNSFDDPSLWEFMPEEIDSAKNISKIGILSLRTQAFGFYENGKLVRSGPVNTGKESTPTPAGLYFTNWKGRTVVVENLDNENDEWILNWNFNIDNEKGISLHQYTLPGYPASHSCIRMHEEDAKWFYHWADQWVLTPDGNTEIAKGTPVIVYGEYDFDKEAPWKRLVSDIDSTKVTQEEIEKVVKIHLDEINLQ